MNMLYETLKERGYIYQMTNETEVKKLLNGQPMCCYVGIDPTADSLHIGHCMPLILGKYIQDAGHRVIVVLGGATAMIGDPSGKNDMRKLVSSDFVDQNRPGIELAISKFLKLDGSNPAIIVNNADWFKGYDYIDFMRDIGRHFNVNQMLACEAYKKRLQSGGLTFFEMGYMLMQAYDFVHLNREYGCRLEFGGSDQWTNILAGADLGRKLSLQEGKDAETFQAFTNVLLLNADGVKMGKTEKGAVWVDSAKMSVYDFFQYFYNIDDRDVEKMFKLLTYLSLDEIADIMKGDIREAKRKFAYEFTMFVHGQTAATEAMATADALFGGEGCISAPTVEICVDGDQGITDLMVASGLCSSKGEAKRLIEQGGIMLGDDKVLDAKLQVSMSLLQKGVLLRRGKKQYIKVIIAD